MKLVKPSPPTQDQLAADALAAWGISVQEPTTELAYNALYAINKAGKAASVREVSDGAGRPESTIRSALWRLLKARRAVQVPGKLWVAVKD